MFSRKRGRKKNGTSSFSSFFILVFSHSRVFIWRLAFGQWLAFFDGEEDEEKKRKEKKRRKRKNRKEGPGQPGQERAAQGSRECTLKASNLERRVIKSAFPALNNRVRRNLISSPFYRRLFTRRPFSTRLRQWERIGFSSGQISLSGISQDKWGKKAMAEGVGGEAKD